MLWLADLEEQWDGAVSHIWPLLLASEWIMTFTTLKWLQSSNLQFPQWDTSVQISSFILHFLELCICYKTLCEILNFSIISCCPQLGSVTLVVTGVSRTTGFLGAMGFCPILSFPLCSCPDFPCNWLLHRLFSASCVSVYFYIWTFLMYMTTCIVHPSPGSLMDGRHPDY